MIKQQVEDEAVKEFGIIMNSNDSEVIYENLINVLNDKTYIDDAIEKSYTRLVENFTWEKTAQKVCEICENIEK